MRLVGSRRGFTVLELMLSTAIMLVVFGCTAAMLVATMRCYDSETAQNDADMDAVLAMQLIVNDVREAKNVNILASGRRLRVIFPITTSEGYYDRSQADTAHQIDYYLSDETGTPGRDGTILWRGKDNGRRPVKRDVDALEFEYDDETRKSIRITVRTRVNTSQGSKTTELTQRVVYLRNY